MEQTRKKVIVGITGASGAIYGRLLLEKLSALEGQVEECAVIFSENALPVWKYELGSFDKGTIPFTIFAPDNFFAPPASGSAKYDVMIVCPCTMGTLGRISSGVSNDLMTRAADVTLKEKRRLILVPREAPYNLIHIRNMELLAQAGAIICPASPSFYNHPETIEQLVMTVVDRVLELAGFDIKTFHWGDR